MCMHVWYDNSNSSIDKRKHLQVSNKITMFSCFLILETILANARPLPDPAKPDPPQPTSRSNTAKHDPPQPTSRPNTAKPDPSQPTSRNTSKYNFTSHFLLPSLPSPTLHSPLHACPSYLPPILIPVQCSVLRLTHLPPPPPPHNPLTPPIQVSVLRVTHPPCSTRGGAGLSTSCSAVSHFHILRSCPPLLSLSRVLISCPSLMSPSPLSLVSTVYVKLSWTVVFSWYPLLSAPHAHTCVSLSFSLSCTLSYSHLIFHTRVHISCPPLLKQLSCPPLMSIPCPLLCLPLACPTLMSHSLVPSHASITRVQLFVLLVYCKQAQ